MKKWLNKVSKWLLWGLPIVVFFSNWPIIGLGANKSMNFELSLPLIWLFLFGTLSVLNLGLNWRNLKIKPIKWWIVFPVYASLSLIWSENRLRGFLTVGIIWLIFFSISYILSLKLSRKQILKLLKIHLYGGMGVAIICLLQCFLDVFDVGRELTGLCIGCTYQTIGFPHPNGFAIEPQFMGNLLILPCILSLYFSYYEIYSKSDKTKKWTTLLLPFFLIMVLFICFSRGAFYAFILAVIYLIAYGCAKLRKFSPLRLLILVSLAISGGLLIQGILAQLSPTSEGFKQGITRSIEQMSVGVIKFPEQKTSETVFSGYIEESTTIRLNLNEVAMLAWRKSPIFGVGLGGAGKAIEKMDKGYSSKEIIQNEVLHILLELGVIGILIIGGLLSMSFWQIRKKSVFLKVLILAYLGSMMFFSGLPNVLHIYLMTPIFYLLVQKKTYGKIER